MKRIYFDSEFTGLLQNTTLISLAFIADTGEEFYAEFTDYDHTQLNAWLQLNVISKLYLNECNQTFLREKMHIRANKYEIKDAIEVWLAQFESAKNEKGEITPNIQIWGDVPIWDWMLFCELFGGALNIPKQIHYMPMDVATLLFSKEIDINTKRIELVDIANVPGQYTQHNALSDTYVIRLLVEKILENV